MAITDPCIIFSNIIWFLATFVCFFNLVICSNGFLGIFKNLKFRKKKITRSIILIKELESVGFLLTLINLILHKWFKKWNKMLKKNKKCIQLWFSYL
jgi:hypothetical protein